MLTFRILQHSGFAPDFDQESADLAAGRPNVKNVTLLLGDWWGSGIVHAKVWISDGKDMYIGSANNDWKSLTQVFRYCKRYWICLLCSLLTLKHVWIASQPLWSMICPWRLWSGYYHINRCLVNFWLLKLFYRWRRLGFILLTVLA